ncbi:hypothetical protein Tco_0772912 [Tanacetum coccineum]|uniref:Uncharacterized protein n=1 Tax=Tanacetum coccineum TaxID=301880 RepID=A0ABQ4ZKJ0_9ASTR
MFSQRAKHIDLDCHVFENLLQSEWTRLFWKSFSSSADLPLFSGWSLALLFLVDPYYAVFVILVSGSSDFSSNGSMYSREDLEVLRDLPIYKTVIGTYRKLNIQDTYLFFSERIQKFPGERFASDGWLNILRKIGLQNTCNADIVLECARRVEFLGTESMKPSGFVDDFEEDFSNTRNEVSLEIQKGFPSVSGKKGGKRVLCSYSEAILLKDWPPILPWFHQ